MRRQYTFVKITEMQGAFFGPDTPTYVVATREELSHVHEECRHVFAYYENKFLEALQKTTRLSLDSIRKRTEEPQISKRNPQKVPHHIPLFYTDLMLTIPSISLKPGVDEMQQTLTRGTQMIVNPLKRVLMWGQSRRLSFSGTEEGPFYKSREAKRASIESVVPYSRLEEMQHVGKTVWIEKIIGL